MAGPVSCPTPANDVTKFDMRNANDCLSFCRSLLQAYANTVSGNQRVEVRFGERWTVWNKANVAGLLNLYMSSYAQCPAAIQNGLPNLNPANRVRRGPPAGTVNFFPHM